jgi:hypothetical protein
MAAPGLLDDLIDIEGETFEIHDFGESTDLMDATSSSCSCSSCCSCSTSSCCSTTSSSCSSTSSCA